MNKEEYERFVEALVHAEKITLRDFEAENPQFFEGCLPVEQIAARGEKSLAFGPMRPIGYERSKNRINALMLLFNCARIILLGHCITSSVFKQTCVGVNRNEYLA